MNTNDQPQRTTFVWNRIASWLIRRLFLVAVVTIGGLYMLSFSGRVPKEIGVVEGKLSACPESPNCVSTQATTSSKKMEPIVLSEAGNQASIKKIKAVVAEHFPSASLVTEKENYLHYQFPSLVFRFVDDVEFLVDFDKQQIDFRSASRVGHSDLGANRKRMQKITQLLKP